MISIYKSNTPPPSANFSCMNISKSTQIRSILFLEKRYWTKGKYFKYQSEFRILDDRIYLTKNSPQKYESLATIDDDHNVIEIVNGLRDITSEILPIEEMLNPNRCKVQLSVNWENLRFQDYVLYNNPRLAELQGMKK